MFKIQISTTRLCIPIRYVYVFEKIRYVYVFFCRKPRTINIVHKTSYSFVRNIVI